uniref:DNA2/NAM7 helicase-like C-terminal domain-containing protein n=1 Tax=Oryza punctata TaxID=4537 RepID=A0A0E0MHP2_ORYPU
MSSLNNASRRHKIGVVCLTSNEANVVRSKLRFKHEIHDIIDLQVNSIDCLQEELFDMVILSTISEDSTEVKLVKDNNINAALTISRHFYWIVGNSTALINSEGTWKILVINAKECNCIQRLDINAFDEVEFEMNDVDDATDPNGEPLSKILSMTHAPFQSSLGAIESLMKFQKACLEPPQDFNWILSVDDLKSQYEKKLSKNLGSYKTTLGSEEISEKGCKRLQTALDIMKDTGVTGIDKSEQMEL